MPPGNPEVNGLASRIGLIELTSGCLSVWVSISACIKRDDDNEYLTNNVI